MRPFEGIRIIDITHVLAGPFAAYQLAVLGADVIKVEHPDEPDQSREGGTDRALNRRNILLGGTTLAAGASCTVSVSFKPVSTGTLTATLSVADNATGSPQKTTLTGTGTAAVVTALRSAMDVAEPYPLRPIVRCPVAEHDPAD